MFQEHAQQAGLVGGDRTLLRPGVGIGSLKGRIRCGRRLSYRGALRIRYFAGRDAVDEGGKWHTLLPVSRQGLEDRYAHFLGYIVGRREPAADLAQPGAAVAHNPWLNAAKQGGGSVGLAAHSAIYELGLRPGHVGHPNVKFFCNTTDGSPDYTVMGVEVRVNGLTKSFGQTPVWSDVSLTLPAGEISVLLGPSGTGKSVFLKTLVGLLSPDRGEIWIEDRDLTKLKERELYEVRKLFGVLFQDGALFGSMNIYDNVAFPLREHTKLKESQIKEIVSEKLDMVGLIGAETKLPGEISGGMRKRAGLARALVLNPQIVLFDEPDSGLDPVRTAYLNQLIVDLNQQLDATILIVTHDINTARTVPDNIGLIYHGHLAMFGPREMLLSSEEPVVRQFLNAQRIGPIGMTEEKDADELAAEAAAGVDLPPLPAIPLQLQPSNKQPRRAERAPGEWCRANGIVPPWGSFL